MAAAAVLLAGGVLLLPVIEDVSAMPGTRRSSPIADLSPFPAEPPGASLDLLFIHHSCGGQLLAPPGVADGEACIFRSHPNGGGLRGQLEAQGYVVHEASYGSVIGEDTDMFDWVPKFRDRMQTVLATAHQDTKLPDGRSNRIVAFKSCFPNNAFEGEGAPPGNPRGPALTVWNARAALAALLPEFAKHPDVLFVYVTAPPLAPKRKDTVLKWLARKAGALPTPVPLERSAPLARSFNDWVVSPEGWLAGYPERNVVVFDYYDVLTAGKSDLLAYPTRGGYDSHPSAEGNARAAEQFVPFLNRAVRRAGLAADTRAATAN